MLNVERAMRAANENGGFATAFAEPLLQPARVAPAGIVGPHGKAANKRYDIYRNNVTVSLIESLAAIFPATQRITGLDFFRAMARLHLRETPPTSPLLFEYGRDFPAFIARYEYAQSLPWLADVARIERAWLDAYHAADRQPLDVQALARVPAESLSEVSFVPHPATRIVSSSFAALSAFAAHRGGDAAEPIDITVPEDALITRPGLEVVVRRLPPGGAAFLTLLMAGHTLGEAASATLSSNPAFDLPAAIAGMIEAEAFATLRIGDSQP